MSYSATRVHRSSSSTASIQLQLPCPRSSRGRPSSRYDTTSSQGRGFVGVGRRPGHGIQASFRLSPRTLVGACARPIRQLAESPHLRRATLDYRSSTPENPQATTNAIRRTIGLRSSGTVNFNDYGDRRSSPAASTSLRFRRHHGDFKAKCIYSRRLDTYASPHLHLASRFLLRSASLLCVTMYFVRPACDR